MKKNMLLSSIIAGMALNYQACSYEWPPHHDLKINGGIQKVEGTLEEDRYKANVCNIGELDAQERTEGYVAIFRHNRIEVNPLEEPSELKVGDCRDTYISLTSGSTGTLSVEAFFVNKGTRVPVEAFPIDNDAEIEL